MFQCTNCFAHVTLPDGTAPRSCPHCGAAVPGADGTAGDRRGDVPVEVVPETGYPDDYGYTEPAGTLEQRPDLQRLVRDFRRQIHGLGGFWIGIALLVFVALLIVDPETLKKQFGDDIIPVLVGMASLWLIVGAMTCLKQLWAVYAGLVLSYVNLLGNLLQFNIVGVVILVLVILQAHRVLRQAKQMTEAGLPLTTKG